MMNIKKILQSYIFVLVIPSMLFAQEQEEKIDYMKVVTEIPATSWDGLKMSFSKESLPWWGGILASTAVLYHNDEVILRDFQRVGRDIGLGNEDKTKAALSSGQIDIIRLPTDVGSFMYFLGDGWMHFGIAGGFLYNGYYNSDNRAYNTGLRLIHGMSVSTIFNQMLKRSFGRESPYVRTEDKGRWRPFPSIPAYQEKTSQYDAMPSGHIMTATLVFTIIRDTYPEYDSYLLPTEITWLTLLGYQMVNNGVHWISDYPLGIGMGYVFAKASMNMGKSKKAEIEDPNKTTWMLLPYQDSDRDGLSVLIRY